MADDELKELLDQLDTHTDENDATVERAKESLEATLSSLKLTPEEEAALAGELAQLRELGKKLDETTIEIAAFGMVSRGKSSVLNALMGQDVFQVGATHGTTVNRAAQRWQHDAPDRPGLEGAKLVVVDTPGIDEVGGEVREALARDVARHADLILFVVSGDMQRTEIEALERAARSPEADHPGLQPDRPLSRSRPRSDLRQDQGRAGQAPRPPRRHRDDGGPARRLQGQDPAPRRHHSGPVGTPCPLIDPLKIRILDVLEREGKALVALNTLLIAGDLHADIVARKIRIRDEAANRLIWNFALATGAAVALNPIPVVDIAGGLAVDVGMIVALSKVYGIPLTRRTAASLVRDMMLALGAMGAVGIVSRLVASGIKSSLAGVTILTGGLAAPLTALGYATFGLAQAATAASTSYVLGQGAKTYLRQGCQWGPRGIKTVIQQIITEAKADSVIDRLRDDLKKRIKK